MGISGNVIECCKNKEPIVKSMIVSVPLNKSTTDSENHETGVYNKEKTKKNKINQYVGFTKEELEQINDKININFDKYQRVPLKSSNINLIYQSGIIRSNSSKI